MSTGSSIVHSSPTTSFQLNSILHVANVSSNLFSVNQFSKDNNCLFVFSSDGFSLHDRSTGRIFFRGLSKNVLYPFPLATPSSSSSVNTFNAFLGVKTTSCTWHQRLGHPTGSIFSKLLTDLPFLGTASVPFCKYYQLAKSSKLPFSSSHSTTTKPLELIHSDVWGPSSLASICGFKYYVIFIYDFSRYTWFYPLHCKFDVYSFFMDFKLQLENMLNNKIKFFRSDGEGEFVKTKFKLLFKQCSILH